MCTITHDLEITFPSESQGLLQAAAGSGFIGFSAFQTPSTPTFAGVARGAAAGDASPAGVKAASAGAGEGGKRRVKTAKVDRGHSSGSTGQVRFVVGEGVFGQVAKG